MTAPVIRPEKGSPEFELWCCAIDVVHAVPLKRGQHVFAASVPWDVIDRLRAAVEAVGVDWRAYHPAVVKAEGR